ncbi:hypothetical protein [Streptomyces sp. NPDC056670]|uniref:hypothetical protein n=1 Tax=unclassified Streptomyces TaxID=2593676 RepID=UPI00368CE05D
MASEVPGAQGAGGADLVAHADDLGVVGSDAYRLYEGFRRDGDHARAATFEAARALSANNFASGAALLKLHDTWQRQYTTLRDACAQISNHLDHSTARHAKDDARVRGSLTAVSVLSDYLN